ncbi:chromate transporter [Neorhizobium sp. DT-125]|uniref:chromate transporter n=1 Tax=Neorhizobium sp. DT-125 TaxID=3396163 RepID=UPI003F1AC3BD
MDRIHAPFGDTAGAVRDWGGCGPIGSGIIHGLKVVAVAIVAQAVWGMAKNLRPDKVRASIALAAVLIVIFASGSIGQVAAIVFGGLAGLWLCRSKSDAITGHVSFPVSRTGGAIALALFIALIVGLPIIVAATSLQGLAVFNPFFRARSLVFGGGHVVLPPRSGGCPARLGHSRQVLAGYGAAQAVPSPLFTFAAYLGAALGPEPNGLFGAAIALIAVFLPGFLLLIEVLPFWDAFRARPTAQAVMRGANAAVVGILGAALYQLVWTSAIIDPYEFALALTCFVLLMAWKRPPSIVVVVSARRCVDRTCLSWRSQLPLIAARYLRRYRREWSQEYPNEILYHV